MRVTEPGMWGAIKPLLIKKRRLFLIFENREICQNLKKYHSLEHIIWDEVDGKKEILKFFNQNIVFILAFEQDDKALDCVSYLTKNNENWMATRNYEIAKYENINSKAKKVIDWSIKNAPSHQAPEQWAMITQAIQMTMDIEGDYVEIGVYKGSSAKIAYDYFNILGMKKKCYFLDTFAGFNYKEASESSDIFWDGTHADVDVEKIRQYLQTNWNKKPQSKLVEKITQYLQTSSWYKKSQLKPVKKIRQYLQNSSGDQKSQFKLVKNNICQDNLDCVEKISVCNVDVDLYEAVKAALIKSFPLVSKGGIIIVQDPGKTPALIGARLALKEFTDEIGSDKFYEIYLPSSGQTYLIKK